MQSLFERVVNEDAATIGAIGVQTRNVFTFPPLNSYSFNANSQHEYLTTLATSCIALARDERILAYTTSSAIKLVDLQTGREMRTLVGHKGQINAVMQSNKSMYLWGSASTDCTVTLWDTRQHPANVLIRRFDRPINCLCYSPNDAFLAIGSDHLHMMDPRIKEYRSLDSSSQVLHVCFHPSEYLLATGSEDRLVRFWDIDTEECVTQSDPSDGTLRKIAFHNDGSSLLTLTDRKCCAISWEPFELLGQLIVPQTDYSLDLAASDSEIFVLGRSILPSTLSLLGAPYAKFLIQEKLVAKNDDESGKLKLANELEHLSVVNSVDPSAEDNLEKQSGSGKDTIEYCGDYEAFIPTYEISRTSLSRLTNVMPHAKNTTVPMTTTTSSSTTIKSMPTKVKTLKTKGNEKNSKLNNSKGTSSTRKTNVVGSRVSHYNLSTRKGIHSNGAIIEATNSMPDIRAISRKEETNSENDELKLQQRHCQRKQSFRNRDQDQEIPSEPSCSLDDITNGLNELEMLIDQRRAMLEDVLRCWRSRGSEAAITEATHCNDIAVLVELIDAFNQIPAIWNLTLCTAILPHIETLFADKHEDSIEVALAALRAIITGCGDVIRAGSHRRFQIGVDIPAEERHSKCIMCMQQLTNIRVKATLLADCMNKSQSHEFSALMQIFDDTLSPS